MDNHEKTSERHALVARVARGFGAGRISRRDSMKLLLGAGFTAGAAGSLLSAAGPARAAEPRKGGRFRLATNLHGPNDTLDPVMMESGLDYYRGAAYYNGLTRFNEDLSLTPELAEEYSANADATEFTFKLRQGVEFHDGKKLTADDVIYSMNRHLGEDSVSGAKALVSMIKEWKKVDTHTVKAILETPNSDLPAILATAHFKIVQDGASGEYFQKPAGTGPFVCEEFNPGIRSIGRRNENYWRETAHVEEFESFAITDSTSRVNALLARDVDMIMAIDPNLIDQVEATEGMDVVSIPSGAYSDIVAMLDREPGNNPDFVMGLKYLQRRDRVVQTILKGHGTIGNDHPIGPAYNEHCADLEQRAYDPDKAKFHLEKSGVTSAVIHAADIGNGLVDMCLMLQREAQKIGFNLEVKRVPNDGYWGTVWMKQPLMVSNWNMRPTANTMLSFAYASTAPWNESQWKDEAFDELLLAARAEPDAALRSEMFCDMQRMIRDGAGTLIAAHPNLVDGKASYVQGVPEIPLGPLGSGALPESVWIDA